MKNAKRNSVRAIVAVFLTLIPIAVFNSVWHIIKVYLPIINATAMVLSGSMLIIMYIKGYSWGSMAWRLRNLFVEKQDFRQYMKARFDPDPLYKSKSVLIVGTILLIGAIYLLSQYDYGSVEQQRPGLINTTQGYSRY